jgi:hypothetical protein
LYNQVRFGNVLETGLQYQLNKGDTHMIVQGGALFNLRYFFSNLLYYTLGPLRLRASFPLVRPLIQPHPAISKLMAPLSLPSAYHLENVSGIVFAAPILLLSAVLGMHIVCRVIRLPYKALANDAPGDNSAATMGQLSSTAPILLAAIASALPTLFYFWVANRFLLDSTPLLAIAAVAGAWIVWSRSQGRPIEHAFLNAVIVILATVSLLIGLLLAFSGQRFLFDDLNPGVWHALSAPFLR